MERRRLGRLSVLIEHHFAKHFEFRVIRLSFDLRLGRQRCNPVPGLAVFVPGKRHTPLSGRAGHTPAGALRTDRMAPAASGAGHGVGSRVVGEQEMLRRRGDEHLAIGVIETDHFGLGVE
jgi:hypothetical protein